MKLCPRAVISISIGGGGMPSALHLLLSSGPLPTQSLQNCTDDEYLGDVPCAHEAFHRVNETKNAPIPCTLATAVVLDALCLSGVDKNRMIKRQIAYAYRTRQHEHFWYLSARLKRYLASDFDSFSQIRSQRLK